MAQRGRRKGILLNVPLSIYIRPCGCGVASGLIGLENHTTTIAQTPEIGLVRDMADSTGP